ncbi:vinorine synthase-like protein [Tanacetum coccineum]
MQIWPHIDRNRTSIRRVVNDGMDENNTRTVDLEIISTERIKPASPTSRHLRTFNLSAIDQLMRLKESLSKLLTDYYPFAGEITDNLYIEYNDKGVNFAWAAVASGLSPLPPSFVASKLFPTSPSSFKNSLPSKLLTTEIRSIKRFVFDSKALASLKAQRVACTSSEPASLVWKAAAKAASSVRLFSPDYPHALGTMVNLRKRASPPLPKDSIGNIV